MKSVNYVPNNARLNNMSKNNTNYSNAFNNINVINSFIHSNITPLTYYPKLPKNYTHAIALTLVNTA